jgi:hypothetical protein
MAAMPSSGEDLPVEVKSEIGALISKLRGAGWVVSASRYDAKSFGNWCVDLYRADRLIRLSKDRSQYLMDGSDIEEIKAAGLWKAFDDLEELRKAVMSDLTISGL